MKTWALMLAISLTLLLCIVLVDVRVSRLERRDCEVKAWMYSTQFNELVTIVGEPCIKCGCSIYNTRAYPEHSIIQTTCAKCGYAEKGELARFLGRKK